MESSKTTKRLYYEELRLLLKDTFEAIHRLKKICANPKTHYVFINDHIGDIVISLGYLRAFRERICANSITLVTTKKYKKIVEDYISDYEDIIFLPQYELYRVFLINATVFGEKFLLKEYPNVTIINPADSAKLGFDYLRLFPEMNLAKMIRYGCYALSDTAIFKPLPKLHSSNKDNIALLTIEARTVETEEVSLYEAIVPQLRNLGYEVYTNTEDNICLQGTLPIYKTIHEIRDFVGNGVLIGTRNGLHDLLLYQECKVVAIYPENYEYGNLFSLDMLPNAFASYLELKRSGNNEFDSKKIIDFIRGDK